MLSHHRPQRTRRDVVGQLAQHGGIGVGAERADAAGAVHARRGDRGQGGGRQTDGDHPAALGQPAPVAVQFRADGVDDDVERPDPVRGGGAVVEDFVGPQGGEQPARDGRGPARSHGSPARGPVARRPCRLRRPRPGPGPVRRPRGAHCRAARSARWRPRRPGRPPRPRRCPPGRARSGPRGPRRTRPPPRWCAVWRGCTMPHTRSPARRPSTPAPVAATTPAKSSPTPIGKRRPDTIFNSPARTITSCPFTLDASTATRTSPAPGAGRSTSLTRRTSGAP